MIILKNKLLKIRVLITNSVVHKSSSDLKLYLQATKNIPLSQTSLFSPVPSSGLTSLTSVLFAFTVPLNFLTFVYVTQFRRSACVCVCHLLFLHPGQSHLVFKSMFPFSPLTFTIQGATAAQCIIARKPESSIFHRSHP